MAIRFEDEYVNSTPADANYPEGSAKNTSTPTATDGSPLEKAWVNDIQGLLQKLIDVAGITPSGVADTVPASDYFKSLSNMVAVGSYAIDTGAVDAYVISVDWDTVDTGTTSILLAGSVYSFLPANTNTIGAPTLNVNGLGVKTIKRPDGSSLKPGDIIVNKIAIVKFDGTDFILLTALIIPHTHDSTSEGGPILGQLLATDVTLSGSAGSPPDANTLVKENIVKGWINMTGTGVIVINDSYNVSGIVDLGVGNYTIAWDTDFANINYVVAGIVDNAHNISIDDPLTVGALSIFTRDLVGTLVDKALITIIAIGDQ
jgi:hypothetical protein